MKKILKKEVIIAFILGIILASSIAVYAANINASNIDYKDGKTVEYALNDLYEKQNNNKQIQRVSLGSNFSNNSHDFDATSIPNYQNLTVDNFYLNKVSVHYYWPVSGEEKNYTSNSAVPDINILSYNPSTGILTVDASMVQWTNSPNVSVCFHYEVICYY